MQPTKMSTVIIENKDTTTTIRYMKTLDAVFMAWEAEMNGTANKAKVIDDECRRVY